MPSPPDVTPAAVEAIKLVRDQDVDLFCDRASIPCMRIPHDTTRRTWSLRSDRIQAWLALAFEEATGRILRKSELNDVLRVLEGLAFKNPVKDSDDEQLWRRIEEEPLLQAVCGFMEAKDRWEARTKELLDDLRKIANECQIDTFTKKWPTIERLLSAKLNRHKELLRQVGILVTIEHRRTGSWTILTKPPRDARDEETTPASQSNNPQTLVPQQRDAGDAGDADTPMLNSFSACEMCNDS
jgi:hypothetical protein